MSMFEMLVVFTSDVSFTHCCTILSPCSEMQPHPVPSLMTTMQLTTSLMHQFRHTLQPQNSVGFFELQYVLHRRQCSQIKKTKKPCYRREDHAMPL